MADTITSYKRSKSDAQITRGIRVPSSNGMSANTSATARYIENLDRLANAGGKLAMAYMGAIENRDKRDADTAASKLFRERRINVLQNVKGKDADGLLDREDKWQKDEFDKWVKDRNIDMVAAREIWRRHADTYLDRTGSYMVEQQSAYDKQSRALASDEANDRLVDTAIGDVGALEVVFAENRELFKDDLMMAERQNDKAIMTAVGAWARQNPSATVNWFNKNKESLKKTFGAKFLTVTDVIDKAERKIQAEVQHAEVLASRAQRLQEKARKQYSEKALNDFLTLAVRGEADAAALYSITDDPNVSSSDKQQAFNIFKGLEKAEAKAADDKNKAANEAASQDVLKTMVEFGASSPEAQTKLRDYAAKGNLTATDISKLNNAGEKLDSVPDNDKPFVKDAYKYVSDMYAGPVPFGQVQSPQRLEQANMMRNAITNRVKESPATAAEDLNINDPNSWLSKLIRINKPVDSKMTNVLTGTFVPGTSVIQVPGASSKGSTTGNAILDKLKARQGK